MICRRLGESRSTTYEDPDEQKSSRGLSRGLALVGVESVKQGKFQYKLGSKPWYDVPADLGQEASLFLRGIPENRVRYVPPKHFAGQVTCKRCPDRLNNKVCPPCPLNFTAAQLIYVAWDGSDGTDDGKVRSSSPLTSSAVSFTTASTAFDVVPAVVDTTEHGKRYAVAYNVRDNVGNPATETIREVNVRDTTGPLLHLVGGKEFLLEGGTEFIDPGATALDMSELDVTPSITIVSISPNRAPKQPVGGSEVCDAQPAGIKEKCEACYSTEQKVLRHENVCAAAAGQCPPVLSRRLCIAANANLSDINPFTPIGSKFTIKYKAFDSKGKSTFEERVVEIVDTSPPAVFPEHLPKTFSFTGVEYAKDGKAYSASQVCPQGYSCAAPTRDRNWPSAQRFHFSASNLNELGCFLAVDAIDGDMYCRTSYSVYEFPPASEYYPGSSRASYSNVRYADKCLTRDLYNGDSLGRTIPQETCYNDVDEKAYKAYDSAGLMKINPSAALGTRYLIAYTVQDATGRESIASYMVIVVDTTPPVLTFPLALQVDFGSAFTAFERRTGVAVVDNHDKPEDCSIYPGPETINTVKPGNYVITYEAQDSLGNTGIYNRTVAVKGDTFTPPDDRETVTMNLRISRYSQDEFQTLASYSAFKLALVNALATLGTRGAPSLTYLNPKMVDGDIGGIKIVPSGVFGQFDVEFSLLTKCGDGGRAADIINGIQRYEKCTVALSNGQPAEQCDIVAFDVVRELLADGTNVFDAFTGIQVNTLASIAKIGTACPTGMRFYGLCWVYVILCSGGKNFLNGK